MINVSHKRGFDVSCKYLLVSATLFFINCSFLTVLVLVMLEPTFSEVTETNTISSLSTQFVPHSLNTKNIVSTYLYSRPLSPNATKFFIILFIAHKLSCTCSAETTFSEAIETLMPLSSLSTLLVPLSFSSTCSA